MRYPFSDLISAKVRPVVVINASHTSQGLLIVPLTSRTTGLLAGEFVLAAIEPMGDLLNNCVCAAGPRIKLGNPAFYGGKLHRTSFVV